MASSATVHPVAPERPSLLTSPQVGTPRARPHSIPNSPATPPSARTPTDPFYGHERIARICARFITHLFACPENPSPSSPHISHGKLPSFIAYALHRTKLHPSVTMAALVLLQRLKARFPTARGSSGHRLFISAFMIASKVMCDDTYSNKSWAIVAQGLFGLREINQMEREMCGYLDWELAVDNHILTCFQNAVCQDFATDQDRYPFYPPSTVSRRAPRPVPSTLDISLQLPRDPPWVSASGCTALRRNATPNNTHRSRPTRSRAPPSPSQGELLGQPVIAHLQVQSGSGKTECRYLKQTRILAKQFGLPSETWIPTPTKYTQVAQNAPPVKIVENKHQGIEVVYTLMTDSDSVPSDTHRSTASSIFKTLKDYHRRGEAVSEGTISMRNVYYTEDDKITFQVLRQDVIPQASKMTMRKNVGEAAAVFVEVEFTNETISDTIPPHKPLQTRTPEALGLLLSHRQGPSSLMGDRPLLRIIKRCLQPTIERRPSASWVSRQLRALSQLSGITRLLDRICPFSW